MKKISSLILIFAVIMGLSITAFATDLNISGNTTSDVTASYSAGSTAIIYSVDITWGDMEFTYSTGSKGEWDPNTHAYKEGTAIAAGWSCGENANLITITNHSNTAVGAYAVFEPSAEFAEGLFAADGVWAGVTGNSTDTAGNSISIASAADNNEAVSEYFIVSVTGEVSEAFEDLVIGTITVTIR